MANVNVPTNFKVKEQDINTKLQLYGIYSAFANGKAPSNKQIDVAMNSALASKPLSKPSSKLSKEGQELVGDLREVIKQAKNLILSKNEGDLLQQFIWETQHINGGDAKLPGAPIDKNTAQQHGNQALDGLRTLGTLILSNGQFRKLLSDASILVRDIAGDAATNAAGKVNPSDEQLSQIDRPAADNTWHDVPDLSKDNLKNQAKAVYNKQKPVGREDLQSAAGDATQAAHPSGSRDPADAAYLAAQNNGDVKNSSLDHQSGAAAAASNLRQSASENVPEETKQNANKYARQTKDYMSKKMPEERREQTIFRLKKMIVEIQGHSDYQQAIETLLNLAETYAGHGKSLTNDGLGTVKGAHTDNSLKTAETNLRTLIERFANSTSSDDFFDALNNIYRDADKDPELKNWFKSIDSFVRKCLTTQGYILEPASTDEWNKLYDQGNFLLRDRYRDHTNRILDEVKFFGKQFDEDKQNKEFGLATQRLFQHLGNDENGKPKFKKHLVQDLSAVILPAIFENVRYVPIPRIEVSDPMVDVVVENLCIESDNLMPNAFEFGSDNYFRWGRKKISNKHNNKVMISVTGVQLDLRDVSYYIHKKQGFPSIKDTGVMDIILAGEGLSFKIEARTAHKKDRQHFVTLDKVTVDVKSLNIKLKKSSHKMLFNVFKPLLFKVVRPAIQKVVEKQIRDSFTKGDALAWEVHQEAQKAVNAAKENPEEAGNIYNYYYSAFQQKIMEGKQKAEKVANRDTKVNMAVTKHDSIFQNINLPGGISTKATEYKELAAKGEKWESPVFSIGSAAPSKDIPHLAPITRKPHSSAQGSLVGGNTGSSNTGNFSNQGYSNQGTGNYSNQGTGNYSNQGTGNFSNQVNQAFGSKQGDLGFNNNGNTGLGSTSTTLGSGNPVYNGTA